MELLDLLEPNDTNASTLNTCLINKKLAQTPQGTQPYQFRSGTYTFNKIILPSKATLDGYFHAKTVFQASNQTLGALIESDRYQDFSNQGVQWDYQDSICIPKVSNLTLSGSSNVTYVNDEPYNWDKDKPYEHDAIRLFSSAPILENLHISNFRGNAVHLTRGIFPLGGNVRVHDFEKPRLRNLSVNKCFTGIVLNAIDSLLDGYECYRVRDTALKIGAGATQVNMVHIYGVPVGIDVLQNAGMSYFSQIEVENCKVGFRIGWGCSTSMISNLRAFTNTEVALDLGSSVVLSNAVIHVPNDAVGINMINAQDSHLNGVFMGLNQKSTGVQIGQNSHRVRLELSSYGGKALKVVSPVDDLDIKLSCGGSDVGVSIDNLGLRNKIDITTVGSLGKVITYPGGGTTFNLHQSNSIKINGVEQNPSLT